MTPSDYKKSSRIASIQRGAHKSIKKPPILDNLGIISPSGVANKAQTSKAKMSNRMKSNDSKRSQTNSKNDNATINTQELTNFFEYRINKNDYDSKQRLNNTVIVENYRPDPRKRDSKKTRISVRTTSMLNNSELMPLSQQRLMDMIGLQSINSNVPRHKMYKNRQNFSNLESAYYPIKLKKKLIYDSKMFANMQKFPNMLNSKGKNLKFKVCR